ncbi:saccharopine dehydrogenase NADP-binding domain-containing protein [Actinomycetaceae bacterium L2_0104]
MRVMVYGTGRMAAAITASLLEQDAQVLVAGRDGGAVAALERQFGVSGLVAEVGDRAIDRALAECFCLVNAAGPFHSTAPALMDKCVRSGAHYVDVSNEHGILDCALHYGAQTEQGGLVLVPGLGFGVCAVEYAVRMTAGEGPARDVLVDIVSPSHGSTPGVAATVGRIRSLGPRVAIDGQLVSPASGDEWLGKNASGGVPLASGALEALQCEGQYQRLATRYASTKEPVHYTSVSVEARTEDGNIMRDTMRFSDTTTATLALIGKALHCLGAKRHPVGVLTPLQFLGITQLGQALFPE